MKQLINGDTAAYKESSEERLSKHGPEAPKLLVGYVARIDWGELLSRWGEVAFSKVRFFPASSPAGPRLSADACTMQAPMACTYNSGGFP